VLRIDSSGGFEDGVSEVLSSMLVNGQLYDGMGPACIGNKSVHVNVDEENFIRVVVGAYWF
jgi:hypothetical protein